MVRVMLSIFAGYCFVIAVVYLLQGRLIYYPNVPGREISATPSDLRMDYEDVNIEASDGVSLHGWFIRGFSDRVLLFFHGNAGNISHRLESIRQFRSLGLSVLIIDYRGYGQSDGRASERGLYLDGDAAWRYLVDTRGIAPSNIVVFGRSLGGSVAAMIAARYNPAGLIVESSFTSIRDFGAEIYPWLPVRWMARFDHPTRDFVAEADCPILIVHSRSDEIVPFHHGEAIFESAGSPRYLVTLFGSHNNAFLEDSETYLQGVGAFLATLPSTAEAVSR